MLLETLFVRVRDTLARHWITALALIWLVAVTVAVWLRWKAIIGFGLPDTDDNLRMAQVQAWLNGQGWYDLRQYKLAPPEGFDIHWSRLVDLPIAAIQLAVQPITGGVIARKTAAALAPLLPLAVVLGGLALITRRLVAPAAFVVAAALLFASGTAVMLMFMPLRVDHHGWQLAMLVLTLVGITDCRPLRGGIISGASSAFSLAIGLELMPFLVLGGAAIVLRWVFDVREGARLRGYGLALLVGVVAGYIAFASYANAVPRCDALTPVWATTMAFTGALLALLSLLRTARATWRLAAAAAAAALLAAGFMLLAPQCLGRPEQVSAELYRIWLSNVREAKPLYQQGWRTAWTTAALPLIGVAGSLVALCRTRDLQSWGPVTLIALVSLALVLWQTRAGAAAQLMAVPGATWLLWYVVAWLAERRSTALKVAGIAAAIATLSGAGAVALIRELPGTPEKPWRKAVTRANALCPTLWAMQPLARLPATTVFTFVDLGPRIVNVTHHKAIAGPYHRNGRAILDVHHAFGGAPDEARAIMRRRGARLLVICPNMSEATVHRARHPNGFYARLIKGERFDWLEPVAMPANRPLRAWRIR